MTRPAPQPRSLDDLMLDCQQSAVRRHAQQLADDDSACFELFRRAIEDENQVAWSALHTQYYRLVAHWLNCTDPEGDDLIEETFVRFWRTLHGVRLAQVFGSLGAVLTYLRKCALSARMDLARQAARTQVAELPENVASSDPPVDEAALNAIIYETLRVAVERWLQTHLENAQERLVVYLSYDLGLSPAEIAQRHPERFVDVREVHRIKERLLKRMRRSAELRALFETSVGKSA